MNINFLKNFIITILTVIMGIEALFLWGVPTLINACLNTIDIPKIVKEQTNLNLEYNNVKIKTYPNFSLRIKVNDITLTDENNLVANVSNLDTRISLPTIILKKINIKNVTIKDATLNITRKNDKRFYLGNYLMKLENRKKQLNVAIKKSDFQSINLKLSDKYIKQTTDLKIQNTNFSYIKNSQLKLKTNSSIWINNEHKSLIVADINTDLKKYSCKNNDCFLEIKNIDLSDYTDYLSTLTNTDITKAKGIITTKITGKKNNININAYANTLELNMKDSLDNIKSNSPVKLNADMHFEEKRLVIDKSLISGNDWNIGIEGNIKNITDKELKTDLKLTIQDSNIDSLYWLLPSIKDDPFNSIQKIKYYGVWGIMNANLELKGNINRPEIYGQAFINDLYLVKNSPIVPHTTVNLEFIKDQVKIATKIFTSKEEYVDIKGKSEIKPYAKGEFEIISTPNVDMEIAQYMLVPIHEVVGFDIGPVPYMKLQGKGNIKLKTKGTILDGNAYGQFNFKNTTATLEGLNLKLDNTTGTLDFNGRDLHFYTKSATINNQLIKIDGNANLDGNIDIDVTSNKLDLSDLLHMLNTSDILATKKHIANSIKKAYGDVNALIKIKGNVKDYGEILRENTLDISGKLHLKDCVATTIFSPLSLQKTSGIIAFEDTKWNANLNGKIGSSSMTIIGNSNKSETNININANSIKTDELFNILCKELKINQIPKTNSLINIKAHYKSKGQDIDIQKLKAQGEFSPLNKNLSDGLNIQSGYFELENGNLTLRNLRAKQNDSTIYANGNINGLFTKKHIINGTLNIENFDIKAINNLRNTNILPTNLQNLVNTYKDYQGKTNIQINCLKNVAKGKIELNNIKFNHDYYNTPIQIKNGDIILDGNKIEAKSIIAKLDNIPVFLNLNVSDLDKTAKIKGYLTTKINEQFVNKYINSKLTYPVKVKGDITLTMNIGGNLNNIKLTPRFKFAPNSDIYYMGANLGDEKEEREIYADLTVNNNSYNLKKMDYIRYMTSQNASSYPIRILTANGQLTANKNNILIKNLNIETLEKANAKLFNVIFKKSIIKSGLFTCKLFVKGNSKYPIIIGEINTENLDLPIYNTFINNLSINAKENLINIKALGMALDSDFEINAVAENSNQLPIEINDLNIKSEKINLDLLINYLTQIPTPTTATKLVSSTQKNISPKIDISDVIIKKGSINTKEIIIKDLIAQNFKAEFKLTDKIILEIPKLSLDITTGNIEGEGVYEFNTGKIKTNLSAFNVDSNKIATTFFEFKDQIYGAANGNIVMSTNGNTEEERLKNMNGHAYFEIADGKMPKLGSVEYLLRAGNFIKSGITGLSISNIIDIITPIKTGNFESIKGSMSIKNGVAQNLEVYSKSDNLNLFINGEYDMIQEYANLRVYGRLTKKASNILGKIGNLSLNNLIAQIPGIKMDNQEKVSIRKELNKIPGVELNNEAYRIFTVKIDGDINEEKYVKNFRWIE